MKRRRVAGLLTTAVIITMLLPLVPASAQTYTDLHDFKCATGGCGPTNASLLAQARDRSRVE
jgi:hypothetical protein